MNSTYSNPRSYNERVGAGLLLKSIPITGITKEKYECSETTTSCERNYNGCCVPRMGNIVLAQRWLVNKKTDKFTLNGLWPYNCMFDKAPEEGCDTSRNYSFLARKISTDPKLKERLETYMPSDRGTNMIHWRQQWEKHGTCLSTVENRCIDKISRGHQGMNPGDDAVRYFFAALDIYDEYNIMKRFKMKKIKPSNSPYQKEKIMNALAEFKGYMSLHCVNNKLKEVRFYLLGGSNNNFYPRSNDYEGDCPDYIYLPVQVDRSSLWKKDIQKPYLIGGRDL